MGMKKMVCEACSSNELVKKGMFFECKICGTKYALDNVHYVLIGEVDDSFEKSEQKGKIITRIKLFLLGSIIGCVILAACALVCFNKTSGGSVVLSIVAVALLLLAFGMVYLFIRFRKKLSMEIEEKRAIEHESEVKLSEYRTFRDFHG